MKCQFPSPCWFAVNVQNTTTSYDPIYSSEEVKVSPTYLDTANKYWDIIYQGWINRPYKFHGNVALWMYGAEMAIDIQLEVLNDIRHGKYKDTDMYNEVERDRVETIGFKPIYSPGGFVI